MKKTVLLSFRLVTLVGCLLATAGSAAAQGDADIEAKFIAMLKNATLKGTWAPVQQGRLGGEKGDDSYRIARVEKIEGSKWSIVSVFTVRDRQVEFPIPSLGEIRRRHGRSHSGQRPRRPRESQLVGSRHVPRRRLRRPLVGNGQPRTRRHHRRHDHAGRMMARDNAQTADCTIDMTRHGARISL